MKVEKFENIIAWQKAKVLTLFIHKVCKSSKDFGLRYQIQRASISSINNIAEGFERKGDKEFKLFCLLRKVLVPKLG